MTKHCVGLVSVVAVLFYWAVPPTSGAISSMSYHPKGNNPVLYEPEVDPIMNLDEDTFVDTVLNPNKERAVLVNYYKDWCGHCRRLVPYYKQLARSVQNWPLIQIAVINCADAYNVKVCRSSNIPTVPKLKYFPRRASKFSDGHEIEHSQSAMEMRSKLQQKILDEVIADGNFSHYQGQMPYIEKCDLQSLCRENNENGGMRDPWEGVPEKTKYEVIIFEQVPDKGVKLTLDLLTEKSFAEVKRVQTSPEQMLMPKGQHFPFVVFIERGQSKLLLAESFKEKTLSRIKLLLQPMLEKLNATETEEAHKRKHLPVVNCEVEPEKCKQMFFVSEVDMLKAIRKALLDEVLIVSSADVVTDENFDNLRNFVSFVWMRFPQKTSRANGEVGLAAQSTLGVPLDRSQRAMRVVLHLKDLLDSKATNKSISTEEWKRQFEEFEKSEGNPFPMEAPWEHCHGLTSLFRGFTCGLWTAFHTMAVQAYLGKEANPQHPLKSIQGWVKSFFGCSGCRKLFMAMTTTKFPIGDQVLFRLDIGNSMSICAIEVRKPDDIVLYLWNLHNIVNNRLHGDETTEDPQFPKEQFPPKYLCEHCRTTGDDFDNFNGFDEGKTLKFLVNFGTNIKPYKGPK